MTQGPDWGQKKGGVVWRRGKPRFGLESERFNLTTAKTQFLSKVSPGQEIGDFALKLFGEWQRGRGEEPPVMSYLSISCPTGPSGVEDIREMGKPPETPNPKPEREMGKREKKPRNQRGKWEKERRNPETREENGKKKRTGREKGKENPTE